jgi:hypothetical protein
MSLSPDMVAHLRRPQFSHAYIQGSTIPKFYEVHQISGAREYDTEEITYWGPKYIRRHRTKSRAIWHLGFVHPYILLLTALCFRHTASQTAGLISYEEMYLLSVQLRCATDFLIIFLFWGWNKRTFILVYIWTLNTKMATKSTNMRFATVLHRIVFTFWTNVKRLQRRESHSCWDPYAILPSGKIRFRTAVFFFIVCDNPEGQYVT